MENKQINQLYIIAINRNNQFIQYQQKNFISVLTENGYRETKLIKAVFSEQEAISFITLQKNG